MNITVNFNLPDDSLEYNLLIQSKNMFEFVSDVRGALRYAEDIDKPLSEIDAQTFLQRASEILFEIDENT